MNTISSLFAFIGNFIGANPSTLTTSSKKIVGAINEVDADIAETDAKVTSLQPNVIALPAFSDLTEVYRKEGITTADTVTISEDGWYVFQVRGGWDGTSVYLNNNTSKAVFAAQVTTSNVSTTNTAIAPVKAGTTFGVRIGNSLGAVIISKIA